MKTIDIMLKILEKLERSLDENIPDLSDISANSLGITQEKRSYILEMMQDAGLIKDVNFSFADCNRAPIITYDRDMNITLSGIMFLEDNTTTAKIIKAAKLLKDTIPGI